jgi:maltooligosyltrehalose synthase
MFNSLAQTILKFTCPGVPDIYQGTELWDLSLVDPDNRRPVDYNKRMNLLLQEKPLEELAKTYQTGDIKLALLQKLIQIRNEYAELFAAGEYVPLPIDKKYNDHVLAFMRKHGRSAIVVIVPVKYAEIASDSAQIEKVVLQSIPENFLQRKLLHFADLFQIIHLDLVA